MVSLATNYQSQNTRLLRSTQHYYFMTLDDSMIVLFMTFLNILPGNARNLKVESKIEVSLTGL